MRTIMCLSPNLMLGRHVSCDHYDATRAATSAQRFSNLARGNAVARLTPAIAIDVGNYAKTYR